MSEALSKYFQVLNDEFADRLARAMASRFDGLRVVTNYNVSADVMVTMREDGEDFEHEQIQYLAGWSDGYGEAMELPPLPSPVTGEEGGESDG